MSTRKAKKIEIAYDDTLVGYARVSTEDQSLDMQLAALERAGVHPDRIRSETCSGAAKRRPARTVAAKLCRDGDTFVVWKLDRVGRDVIDVYNFVQDLERRGVKFRSLTEYIDTSTPFGRMAFHNAAGFAQFERDMTRQRTAAGIERAKERGVKFGQPRKFGEAEVERMKQMFRDGMSKSAVARAMKCAPGTIENYIPAPMRADLKPK